MTRIEHDFLGDKEVAEDVYYGVQTSRALENFIVTQETTSPALVKGMAIVKKACARANHEVGLLEKKIADAIMAAADEVKDGKFNDQFITDPIQGGAGTSVNMNTNEVIANRALEMLGEKRGSYNVISPNSHVNMSQSTNDSFPTGFHLALLMSLDELVEVMTKLSDVFKKKGEEFGSMIKMGRTHIQDAVPICLGQEFIAYATVLDRNIERIKECYGALYEVNLGATAVGTGLNADPVYIEKAVKYLAEYSGYPMVSTPNLMDGTQNTDSYMDISSRLKTTMMSLSKVMNDLRLMASGPRCGLNEINLPMRQPGSSIMPGKVNPVMAEVVNQTAFVVAGMDLSVTLACEAGQFELNVMEPTIVYCMLKSIQMMTNVLTVFRVNCLEGITANEEVMQGYVDKSVGVIAAINPHVGYETASQVARKAVESGRPVREVVLEMGVLTEEEIDIILNPAEMTTPGISGKQLIDAKQ